MKLIITRHGETDYNQEHIHDHLGEAMLTTGGLHRSQVIAQLLRDVPIDQVFSSPLQRCIDTIQPFCIERQVNPIIEPRLTEIRLDCMQGKSWNNVSKEFNQQLHDIHAPNRDGCEHMSDVRRRIAAFMAEIYEQYSDKTILICTHAGVMINLAILLGDSIKNSLSQLPNNTGLTKDEIFQIRDIQHSHIEGISAYITANPQ